MSNSFKDLPHKFPHSSILVIGDFMIDEYVQGTVDRISPEAPVPVVLQQSVKQVPGGAGNVVCNLKALGARVLVAGVVGRDENGARLKETITSLGVDPGDISLLELEDRPTTRKIRIMAGNQQVCRLDLEKRLPLPPPDEKRMLDFIRDSLPHIQAIIFSDYDKGVITPTLIQETVRMAREQGVFTAVDPQVTHFHYYQGVDVLTPNHHEAGRFLRRDLKTDQEVEEGGLEILNLLQAKMLLITRGEKGMTLLSKADGSAHHFPTFAREVFDVTGAGDTVISIFSLAMTVGAAPEEAVVMSNHGAGIVVGRLGAATVTVEELVEDLLSW